MKTILFLFSLAFVVSSCTNLDQNEDMVVEDSHQHDDSAIELVNGEKWIVVPEMMQYIRNMETNVLTAQQDTNLDSLTLSIRENLDLLTSNCTMSGRAHDELHKWLLPFIDLVQETEKSEDKISSFNELNNSFTEFNEFFK